MGGGGFNNFRMTLVSYKRLIILGDVHFAAERILFCSNNVRCCLFEAIWIEEILQAICADAVDVELLQYCRLLKEDIGDCQRCVVSAAIFSITKEYVTAVSYGVDNSWTRTIQTVLSDFSSIKTTKCSRSQQTSSGRVGGKGITPSFSPFKSSIRPL